MAKKQFKTESKKLLDLMIHSIYTNKEIFLRELISNASDALDKFRYNSLTDTKIADKEELHIEIIPNKDEKTITIIDNGIGMTEEEAINNLGTIARSGSKEFLEKLDAKDKNDEIDIIGQFGVGFYSAFIVGKEVVVKTKSPYSDKGIKWTSSGEDSYKVEECDKTDRGTEITIHLRDDEEGKEEYTEFLETYKVKELVKKYSDYVRYPIKMDITREVPKKDDNGDEIEGEFQTVVENETLNTMIPLWRKNKSSVKTEEYNEFYKGKFHQWEDPLKTIHLNVEGKLSYNALIFIPKKAPFNLYNKDFEKGLQLYTKGVFIMDKNKDLIPDHFMFCKGLIDSADLSLNISREILQHDRQLKQIATNIEKKIKSELEKMQKNDREAYEEFYQEFGLILKYGMQSEFGIHKDTLKDLLMFKSSREKKYVTLKEYVENMATDQKHIYFATGSSIEQIETLPQVERLKDKGYEYLYFLDDVDEFAISVLNKYEEKDFKSINQGDLDIDTEDEKMELEQKNTENKDLLTAIQTELSDKVAEVKLSSRLKSHPVCLTSKDGVSLKMEQVMANMPGNNGMVKAQRVLELNPDHELFNALSESFKSDSDSIKDYSSLLYDQALLIEGLQIEDPVEFSNKMCKLMIENFKK